MVIILDTDIKKEELNISIRLLDKKASYYEHFESNCSTVAMTHAAAYRSNIEIMKTLMNQL
jgi:hypothetical protein